MVAHSSVLPNLEVPGDFYFDAWMNVYIIPDLRAEATEKSPAPPPEERARAQSKQRIYDPPKGAADLLSRRPLLRLTVSGYIYLNSWLGHFIIQSGISPSPKHQRYTCSMRMAMPSQPKSRLIQARPRAPMETRSASDKESATSSVAAKASGP